MKISVLLPIYKERENWIRLSIESILSQTFTDFELIIIDDNPEEGRNKLLIQEYQDQDDRVVPLINDYNMGLQVSLNRGIDIARGEYIARMDADDISFSTRFEKQIAFLDVHSEYGICGSNAIAINENGNETRKIVFPSSDEAIKAWQLFFVPFIHPSVMIRACLLKENKYDELIKTAEDADLWLKLANKTKFYNIPEYLLYYRMHSQNTTGRNRQDVLIASSKIWYERCFDVYSLDSHYKELYLRFLFECLYGEGVYSSKMANEEVDTLFKYLQEVYHAKKYFYDVLLRMYTSFCVKGYKWNKILFNPFSKKNFLMYIKHLIFLIWRKMSNKSLVG